MKHLLIALVTAGSLASMGSVTFAATESKEKASNVVAAQPSTLKPTAAAGAKATPVDSLPILEKAVARDSSKFDQLYRLGAMYLDRDRISEAGQVLRKANKVRPKDVPTLVNLGAVEDASGQADAAQRYYRAALELSPEDSIASCRLASSLYAQSKYTESMELLRGLIANKPNSHCAYFTLGVAFADAGIYRDAVRMWKKVVELAPNSQEAASARESIDVLEKFISGK